MSDQETAESIASRFPNEWVLLSNPHTNEALEVVAGDVIFHSRDRDEVYREAVRLSPSRSAILYTGNLVPENTAIVL